MREWTQLGRRGRKAALLLTATLADLRRDASGRAKKIGGDADLKSEARARRLAAIAQETGEKARSAYDSALAEIRAVHEELHAEATRKAPAAPTDLARVAGLLEELVSRTVEKSVRAELDAAIGSGDVAAVLAVYADTLKSGDTRAVEAFEKLGPPLVERSNPGIAEALTLEIASRQEERFAASRTPEQRAALADARDLESIVELVKLAPDELSDTKFLLSDSPLSTFTGLRVSHPDLLQGVDLGPELVPFDDAALAAAGGDAKAILALVRGEQ